MIRQPRLAAICHAFRHGWTCKLVTRVMDWNSFRAVKAKWTEPDINSFVQITTARRC